MLLVTETLKASHVKVTAELWSLSVGNVKIL
jgi:hypothetical protein